MIKLKIFGKPSSTYEYMKAFIAKTAIQASLPLEVEEITDTQEFIDMQIMSIPAYSLNGKIEERGNKNINQFLRQLRKEILKKGNYGNMKKITVPIDFSETSDNTISYALNLSKNYNSVVKLMHAYHPSPIIDEGTYVNPEIQTIYQNKLLKFTESLNQKWVGDDDSPIIDSDFKIGFAKDEIQNISEDNPDGWIVMGTSDSSKAVKNMFGSVSTAIAKESKCPVLIVPPKVTFSPLKKIVFCSSDDSLDWSAMAELLELASPFKSEIHIVHVEEKNRHYEAYDLINVLKNKYPSHLIKFTSLKGTDKIDLINNYCDDNDIDLLALVRRKRSIINELFHKSFTKKMTITTSIPLFILHK